MKRQANNQILFQGIAITWVNVYVGILVLSKKKFSKVKINGPFYTAKARQEKLNI